MFIHALLVGLLGFSSQLSSSVPRQRKVLTAEQRSYQAELKAYNAKMDSFRSAANTAFGAEATREKILPCPDAQSTRAENECLLHESTQTQANYKTFFASLQALLALPYPHWAGEPEPHIGPTGPEATPATNTAALNKAEAAWHAYADAECSAVDTARRGGTIVTAMYIECILRMARARLYELDAAYDFELHPH